MMCFKEALYIVCKDNNLARQMYDPFALKSFLEDKCSWSLEEKQKVKEFYQVDKQYKVFSRLHKNGKSEVDSLINEFDSNQNQMSKQKFSALLQTIVFLFDSDESAVQNAVNKQKTQPTPVAPKKPAQQKAQPKPVATNKPTQQKQATTQQPKQNQQQAQNNTFLDKQTTQPVTQSNQNTAGNTTYSNTSTYTDYEDYVGNILGGIMLGIPLLALLLGIVTWIFKIDIPWIVWQWIIGISVTDVLCIAFLIMYDSYCLEMGVGVGYFLIITIPNVLLLLIYGVLYKIIFLWITAQMFVSLFSLSVVSFDDCEDEFGVFFAISAILCLAGFVCVLLML